MTPEAKAAYNRAYYRAHRAELIEYQRRYNASHPYAGMSDDQHRRHREAQARQRRVNHTHTRARVAMAYAVRSGRLVRGPCVVCGDPNTEGHHHAGYEREHWLDVTWLCMPHHKVVHRAA